MNDGSIGIKVYFTIHVYNVIIPFQHVKLNEDLLSLNMNFRFDKKTVPEISRGRGLVFLSNLTKGANTVV